MQNPCGRSRNIKNKAFKNPSRESMSSSSLDLMSYTDAAKPPPWVSKFIEPVCNLNTGPNKFRTSAIREKQQRLCQLQQTTPHRTNRELRGGHRRPV
jgi:hypothetical protein